MYSYTYDSKTGGILLNSSPTGFSKEPRPVYATELDVLGFDKYWKYDKQTDRPYMWAEANTYWYRGKLVAMLKGGNLYTAPEIHLAYLCSEYRETPDGKVTQKVIYDLPDKRPSVTDKKGNVFVIIEPEPNGNFLRPIDVGAMVEANREMLEIIEQTTVKKILAIYTKYKNRLDCFHVAFSGGKDSCVLLDLVKKALPKGSFVVVFGDTGMEFPDTYEVVRKTKQQCIEDEIPFYIAKSHFNTNESWKLFGPPSRVLRWCCSVHKSTPQTLKLREVTGKNNFIGLDFVGVRAQESVARSTYKYENYGVKQKGQFSHNSILEWTSAEIWLYIYSNDILINETYKKGNGRAGCLFCPMSGGTSDYLRRSSYSAEIDMYIDAIRANYDGDKHKKSNTESYILNGGWNARKNGRELSNNAFRCVEKTTNGNLTITVIDPDSDWLEWIKTLGDLHGDNGEYSVVFEGENIRFSVRENKNGYIVAIPESVLKEKPAFGKIFRQVFRKASYCKGCRVCETNCRNGCISFADGKVKINNCIRCHECHAIDSGCLLFHSLRHPQGGGNSMKSLNSFADHAPKPEWLRSFFELKEAFFSEHTLGPMMFDMFRRFLKDASLNEKNHFTPFAELISQKGWETDTAQGLILINLVAENPQMEWYVNNFDVGRTYARQTVEDMLTAVDVKPKDAKSIAKSYKRLVETPLGTSLRWGFVTDEGDLVRTKCSVSDSRVVLYGLFKFAEKCNDYKEFTLATLLNDSIDRDGISPSRIFGLGRDDMTPLLLGLSVKYPEFITASFTHDLEKITLAENKSSQDVLDLFKGDTANG
ncbi:phosphoadenosine phosphosulfate reductase [Dehalococcoides mccartyi]|uniref:phosphoadenosine phosphosulfate reductase domain-containing protein n=1 Tax=Dehalococcoides mccartyi TaxID=61435 RepID=UPI00098EA50C|nr:phosphoadenosine phosphosulfate reductase family protein [Dehalococcoides mccartyi]AQU05373.1 phosphoadenosine phosphosulfate reductase [Dehalococcoides mccartyi]AQU06826.1 phosphoadenosine phosphosulfate reductase [Dehalococcoides mccartyi]